MSDKPARPRGSRSRLIRWQVGYGTFGVPQAAAPIAFALVALPLTGSPESGAGMVFAMTVAQVAGAVPLARWGERFNSVRYLRALIALRTVALAGLTLAAMLELPFSLLVTAAALAGVTNGAAYGLQRTLLNHLVSPSGLPRALGIAATLNEITFAISPVIASLLGAVSPMFAMAAITALGVGPLVLMPRIPEARTSPARPGRQRIRLPSAVYVWFLCAAAGSAAVAAVEIGAVSFALRFGIAPEWGFVFALTLCIGSVVGGIWVSVRNRILTRRQVVIFLSATTAGAMTIAASPHLSITLAGAVIVGLCLPSLGTYYSLVLDTLAPPHRRTEVFALMRTFNAIGIIAVSGVLALVGLESAVLFSAASMLAVTVVVIMNFGHRSSP